MEAEWRKVVERWEEKKKRQEIFETWEGLILLLLALKTGGRGLWAASRNYKQPSGDSKEMRTPVLQQGAEFYQQFE